MQYEVSVDEHRYILDALNCMVRDHDHKKYGPLLERLKAVPETKNGRKRANKIRFLTLRDGNNCTYCHQEFTSSLQPTIDHVIPKSAGGTDALTNLVLSCFPCNENKGGIHGPTSYTPGAPARPKKAITVGNASG